VRLMTVGDALCASAIGWSVGVNLGWALIPPLGSWAILPALLASCGVHPSGDPRAAYRALVGVAMNEAPAMIVAHDCRQRGSLAPDETLPRRSSRPQAGLLTAP
jgi:hypothetical protein